MSIIKSLRSYRVYEIALFDVIIAIIGMVILANYLNINVLYAALSAIPIGIIVHQILGINTELNYKLGLSSKPDR